MAERYPREWFHGGGHYTEEDLARLERLYRPRPTPRPRTEPPPVRAPAPPPPRPVLKAVWTCHHCGKRFPGYTRRARRYCSDRCAHAARWARRRPAGPHPPCPMCGTPFPPYTDLRILYCSKRCNNRAVTARRRARRATL